MTSCAHGVRPVSGDRQVSRSTPPRRYSAPYSIPSHRPTPPPPPLIKPWVIAIFPASSRVIQVVGSSDSDLTPISEYGTFVLRTSPLLVLRSSVRHAVQHFSSAT